MGSEISGDSGGGGGDGAEIDDDGCLEQEVVLLMPPRTSPGGGVRMLQRGLSGIGESPLQACHFHWSRSGRLLLSHMWRSWRSCAVRTHRRGDA